MDSGNSGSMQSSSCGDEIEDYDSRADSNNFSALLNNQPPPTTRINHVLNTTSHPSSIPQQQQHQMFDPLVNYYMDSLQKASPSSNQNQNQNQNSFLNLDMMWAKATGRSEHNNTDLSSLMVPSSSSSSSQQNHHQQAFLLSQLTAGQTRENVASVPTTHQHQQHHSLPQESTSRGGISLTNDQQNLNNNNMGRNPKKRSRASRRAPTTVLTTDTTNFRAMVQEFTGIPAPPFSSPFPRTRLDLFGSSVSSRSLSSQMDPPLHQAPPYLLRPFAQKIQPHYSFSQIPSSSSSFPSLENLASNNSTNSASINYHNHPLMQHNQILGFQSISSPQAPTKYPHGPQQPSLEISPKMGVFEELGLSHAHVNNNNNIGVVHQQNMVPASSERVNNNNNMRNTTSEDQWGQRTSSAGINGDNDGRILGSLSGIQERNSNASEFGVEKGQECGVVVVATTTRGEGTVESWINCSSSD